mmetsp:Transcript_34945/g.55901  ORF Transcript_34945/g.55901 Transcript_34945/m.55901 type:complete len:490 (-) Transcript_34945:52-1521(-)
MLFLTTAIAVVVLGSVITSSELVSQDGMTLVDELVPFSTFSGKQQITGSNVSIELAGTDMLGYLCYQPLEVWRSYSVDPDVLIVPRFNCNLNVSFISGEPYAYWCSLGANVILSDFGNRGSNGRFWVNVDFEPQIPNNCTILVGRPAVDLESYFLHKPISMGSIALDQDRWEGVLRSPWISLSVHFIFPISYLMLSWKYLIYAYRRYKTKRLSNLHRALIILDVPGSLVLGGVGLFTGSHCMGSFPIDGNLHIFFFTELFGLSTASDVILAFVYYEVTESLESVYRLRVSKRLLKLVVCMGFSELCISYVTMFHVSSTQVLALLFVLSIIMVFVQIVVIVYLCVKLTRVRTVLKKAAVAISAVQSGSYSAVESETLSCKMRKLEKRLKPSICISVIASSVNILALMFAGQNLAVHTPSSYILTTFALKASRIANTYARVRVCQLEANPRIDKHSVITSSAHLAPRAALPACLSNTKSTSSLHSENYPRR